MYVYVYVYLSYIHTYIFHVRAYIITFIYTHIWIDATIHYKVDQPMH